MLKHLYFNINHNVIVRYYLLNIFSLFYEFLIVKLVE